MPDKYTCEGENISPELEIDKVSDKAKSLALLVLDPDAPDGTFTHWLMWNIPVDTKVIKDGETPDGATVGTNDFGELGYKGPCPPKEDKAHRYYFKIFALDDTLDLPETTTRKELEAAIRPLIVDSVVLVGKYTRENK
jgi:hypothetical protein